MTEPIPKETARQVLMMLKGLEGIEIQTDNFYYPVKDEPSIEHILQRMDYENQESEEVQI